MARASALHAEGQGFDSLILHRKKREEREKNKKFFTRKYWNERDMRVGCIRKEWFESIDIRSLTSSFEGGKKKLAARFGLDSNDHPRRS